jgi:hypothetical protein
MRKPLIALSLLCAALAATCVHLAMELRAERARPPPLATAAAAAPHDAATPDRAPVTARGVAADPPAGAANHASMPESAEDRAATMKRNGGPRARWFLAQLQDPTLRQQLLEEWNGTVASGYPGLQKLLELGDTEFRRLLELLVQHSLVSQEKAARCTLEPTCNNMVIDTGLQEAQQLEIAALIGAGRQQRLIEYNKSGMERNTVSHLRVAMVDTEALSDRQAEMLISAFSHEHQQFEAELTQRGANLGGFAVTGANFVFASDAASIDVKLNDARSYAARLRERAAQILTPAQLKLFDEAQATGLERMRSWLRQDETEATNRR